MGREGRVLTARAVELSVGSTYEPLAVFNIYAYVIAGLAESA
jgi:hypothetical protein